MLAFNLALAAAAVLGPQAVSGQDLRQTAQKELAIELAKAADAWSVPDAVSKVAVGNTTSHGYAPTVVPCPENITWVRPASGLSDDEKNYLAARQKVVVSATAKKAEAAGLQAPARPPVIALALSGGGYRAMMNGLGMSMALMNTDNAVHYGTAGWIDAVTYMAGLSGGAWGTGTYIANGGQLPFDLANNTWDLNRNLLLPPDANVTLTPLIRSNVEDKLAQGFAASLTDFWSLALGEHLLPPANRLNGNPNFPMSSLPSAVPQLQKGEVPMPIFLAIQQQPNSSVAEKNAPAFEFTPYEFGSWQIGEGNQKQQGYFTPMKYLGTSLNNGQNNGTCYNGFDQLSFAMGTSSSIFAWGVDSTNLVTTTAKNALGDNITQGTPDLAIIPNSFKGFNAGSNPLAGDDSITLIDGGLGDQNIPFAPLTVADRNVDVILALDNSADTKYNWPNGSALYTAYTQNVTRFPKVPSPNGFVNGGLNTRPTFFGCDSTDTPLVVYVPNYPWSVLTNSSTFTLQYPYVDVMQAMTSAMDSLTLGGKVSNWTKCLACALTDRANGFTKENRTQACADCFNLWCWDGVDNTAEPSGDYAPAAHSLPQFLTDKNLTSPPVPGKGSGARMALNLGGGTLATAMIGTILGATLLLL